MSIDQAYLVNVSASSQERCVPSTLARASNSNRQEEWEIGRRGEHRPPARCVSTRDKDLYGVAGLTRIPTPIRLAGQNAAGLILSERRTEFRNVGLILLQGTRVV